MCSLTENGFGYLLLADIGIAVWYRQHAYKKDEIQCMTMIVVINFYSCENITIIYDVKTYVKTYP